MFDRPNVFYSNDIKTILFDENWLLDLNKIQNLKQHNFVILNFSSEHYGVDGIDYVYHALDHAGINFLLLSHNPNDHKKFNRMVFYPYWYHWARKNFIVNNNQTVDKTYQWSCLNGNPRNHRIYNYFYSKKQSYFHSCYFTFYNAEVFRHDDVSLSPDVVDFWNNIKNSLPPRSIINSDDRRCDLPANEDSYIHLVTETTVIPNVFVSEKTWKPVVSGQLFLVFGNPGTIKYLRENGVDVFDDIIDHSYDLIDDWQLRLQQIHVQLEKLLKQDLKNIYINTHQRRRSNVEKFFSGTFDQQYQQTVKQCINMLS